MLRGDVICCLNSKSLPGGRTGPQAGKHCRVRMVRLDEELGYFFMECGKTGAICDDAKAEGRHKLRPGPAAVWAWVWLQPC